MEYYIQKAKDKHPQDALEQKHYLSAEVVPFLKFIADPLEQDHYINELVKNFGISEKVIRGQIAGVKLPAQQAVRKPVRPALALEKEILGGIILDHKFADSISSELDPEDFEDPEVKQAVSRLVSEGTGNLKTDQEPALVKEGMFMVESLLEQLGQEALHKRLLKSHSQLKIESLKKKQKLLQVEIAAAEAAGDKVLLKMLQNNFAAISEEKLKFEKR